MNMFRSQTQPQLTSYPIYVSFFQEYILLWLHHHCKALASGVHPSTDFEGHPLPALHSKLAGKPIAGAELKDMLLTGDIPA
jgi:hypothetical protein